MPDSFNITYDIEYKPTVSTNRQTHETVTLKQNSQTSDACDDSRGLGNVAHLPLSYSSADTKISMQLLIRH